MQREFGKRSWRGTQRKGGGGWGEESRRGRTEKVSVRNVCKCSWEIVRIWIIMMECEKLNTLPGFVCTYSSRGCQVFCSITETASEGEEVWRWSRSGEVSGAVYVELHALLVSSGR